MPPTDPQENLRSLTREAQQLVLKDLPWEPLEVTLPVALEIFSHSRYVFLSDRRAVKLNSRQDVYT